MLGDKKILGKLKGLRLAQCPEATQNIKVNLENRQNAIDVAHYGPLNPNEPNDEYWKAKADMFEGNVEAAKKARCGNCSFFVQTKVMLDCIAEGIGGDVEDEWDTIEAGDLGYCEAFDFKCAANRTCDAWVVGGPITDDNMNKVQRLDIEPNPCWEGYEPYGLKPDGSPNCIPVK